MKRWLKRIGGAVVRGLTWAIAWAPLGLLLGFVVDRDGSMDEPWIAVGVYPGFLCGVLFSVVLGIAGGGRSLGEVPLLRAGAWGALSGLLVGTLPFVLGSQTSSDRLLWVLPVVVIASVTLLSVASAVGSAALARRRGAAESGRGATADAS